MKTTLFALITMTELLYIYRFLEFNTTYFECLVLLVMLTVSIYVRFLLYSITCYPGWTVEQLIYKLRKVSNV